MDEPLRAAILIVSTTASKDPSTDASAQILRDVFEAQGAGRWEVAQTSIVPDDVLAIQEQITAAADGQDPVNLILTTGGTGFAVADKTPEVWSFVLLSRHGVECYLGRDRCADLFLVYESKRL